MDPATHKAITKIKEILDKTMLSQTTALEVFQDLNAQILTANSEEDKLDQVEFAKLQDLQYLINSGNMNISTAVSIFKFIDEEKYQPQAKQRLGQKELESYLNSLIAYQNIIQTKFKSFEAQAHLIKRSMKSAELPEVIADFAYALQTGLEAIRCSIDLYGCYLDLFEQKEQTREQSKSVTSVDLSKNQTLEYDYSGSSVP